MREEGASSINQSGRELRGGPVAVALRERVREEAARLAAGGAAPRLQVFLVGDDAASAAYVASKTKAAVEAGIEAETGRLSAAEAASALLPEVERANADPGIDAILVQLPLPTRELTLEVFDTIDPGKDVDGFNPENVGLLQQGRPRFVPCTPAGILALLDAHKIPLAGKRAVVLGRSEIVGKPMAALLTARDATVTLCHSRTRDLPAVCREADVLVAAIGRPGHVTADFVRPGAVVVDVGITRVLRAEELPEHLRASQRLTRALAERGQVLVGDVDFDAVAPVAGWITPVPGGVGPLTVAMLLANTVAAARRRRGL